MHVSENYTLSQFVLNPKTRDIVLKHLGPLGVEEQHLQQVHTTLKDLADTNMGGGIPYEVMQKLMAELDAITEPVTS